MSEVSAAIAIGDPDERRVINYRKLFREQALNAASLAERRADDRDLGKYYKYVLRESNKLRRGQ